ncbi:MAG: NAD(+) synthase [Gammaproteobacteria bacterium]|nr:NAD(+) synthase [Gammaproteobacteria bacterium]
MNFPENYADLGYVRVAATAPNLVLADPEANASDICTHLARLRAESVTIALFPELSITGYTCEDLFFTSNLLRSTRSAISRIASASEGIVCIVGAPYLTDDGRLLNCAVVIADGEVKGMVPKSAQPNYGEFYERRWFVSGDGLDLKVEDPSLGEFRLCRDQLFRSGPLRFGIEICEDLWAPEPPGVQHSLAGAELILNLSASNDLVAKAEYRRNLVHMASAQRLCGYLYAGAGPMESTKDVVFGGHLLAAENGQPLGESERFQLESQTLIVEFDIDKLRHDRMQNTTFGNAKRPLNHRVVDLSDPRVELSNITRVYPKHPFVPADEDEFDAHAREILNIQTTGLARRMLAANVESLVIGVSGGLDSTLAFLVCLDTLAKLGKGQSVSPFVIHALTMPGPGTTTHTRDSVDQLCNATGVTLMEISIESAVDQHLEDLGHDDRTDVVFENIQARERTQLLFDYANKVGGIVVGTGDLSELALGWCTYNADHMANYNVNAGVPKTMMAYLVRWYARHRADEPLSKVLERVLDTPISPELIAPEDGEISQQTETIIGPYELHDFYLFHYLRNGFSAEKIYALAIRAFTDEYQNEEIKRWLSVFFRRFFTQQFKRTTMPAGPKVGSVSLSPRGDWRMPDEASVAGILEDIDKLP